MATVKRKNAHVRRNFVGVNFPSFFKLKWGLFSFLNYSANKTMQKKEKNIKSEIYRMMSKLNKKLGAKE